MKVRFYKTPHDHRPLSSLQEISYLVGHAGLVEVGKVWVVERSLCCDTLGRLVPHHVGQERDAVCLKPWDDRLQVLGGPSWEGWLVVWQRRHAWPRLFGWCAQKPEDSVELVNLRVAREERTSAGFPKGEQQRRRHVYGEGAAVSSALYDAAELGMKSRNRRTKNTYQATDSQHGGSTRLYRETEFITHSAIYVKNDTINCEVSKMSSIFIAPKPKPQNYRRQ